jgi:type I restriction enzyme M protein
VEKIVSTFERYEDVPGYARRVSIAEIGSSSNDWNLNIRRYVDNSPPPEAHDVRAHLLGGVPVSEVESKRPLFDALCFDPAHAFSRRENDAAYLDFGSPLAERTAIHSFVENDSGVQRRGHVLHDALTAWWAAHATRLAELPSRRDLNAVRREFLDSFVDALLPLGALDRFKLSGVIASWWNDTLPDLKTVVENGFSGVIEGWIDAISDAVEDEDDTGPGFDPFGHRLVRQAMVDYLGRIANARADVLRLRAEKEAFEQSSAPDGLEEEELADWDYPKDLERQVKEIKAEHRDSLSVFKKLERGAAKAGTTAANKRAVAEARAELAPVFEKLAAIEQALAPYEKVQADLSEARTRYRELISRFVDELRARCNAMQDKAKQALVLALFAEDVQSALDAAVAEKRRDIVQFIEDLWNKYFSPMSRIAEQRKNVEIKLASVVRELGYDR